MSNSRSDLHPESIVLDNIILWHLVSDANITVVLLMKHYNTKCSQSVNTNCIFMQRIKVKVKVNPKKNRNLLINTVKE